MSLVSMMQKEEVASLKSEVITLRKENLMMRNQLLELNRRRMAMAAAYQSFADTLKRLIAENKVLEDLLSVEEIEEITKIDTHIKYEDLVPNPPKRVTSNDKNRIKNHPNSSSGSVLNASNLNGSTSIVTNLDDSTLNATNLNGSTSNATNLNGPKPKKPKLDSVKSRSVQIMETSSLASASSQTLITSNRIKIHPIPSSGSGLNSSTLNGSTSNATNLNGSTSNATTSNATTTNDTSLKPKKPKLDLVESRSVQVVENQKATSSSLASASSQIFITSKTTPASLKSIVLSQTTKTSTTSNSSTKILVRSTEPSTSTLLKAPASSSAVQVERRRPPGIPRNQYSPVSIQAATSADAKSTSNGHGKMKNIQIIGHTLPKDKVRRNLFEDIDRLPELPKMPEQMLPSPIMPVRKLPSPIRASKRISPPMPMPMVMVKSETEESDDANLLSPTTERKLRQRKKFVNYNVNSTMTDLFSAKRQDAVDLNSSLDAFRPIKKLPPGKITKRRKTHK